MRLRTKKLTSPPHFAPPCALGNQFRLESGYAVRVNQSHSSVVLRLRSSFFSPSNPRPGLENLFFHSRTREPQNNVFLDSASHADPKIKLFFDPASLADTKTCFSRAFAAARESKVPAYVRPAHAAITNLRRFGFLFGSRCSRFFFRYGFRPVFVSRHLHSIHPRSLWAPHETRMSAELHLIHRATAMKMPGGYREYERQPGYDK